jgi:class 3 adenylate cyclase
MKYFYSLGFLFLFIGNTFGQYSIITLKDKESLLLCGKQTYYYEDVEGNLSVDKITSLSFQKKFQLHDKDVFARPNTKSTYWFKFSVENKSREDAWLEIGSTYAWYIDFYAPDSNGFYSAKIQTGTMRSDSTKQYHVNLFWLPLNKTNETATKTYYIKVKESLSFELPLTVGTIRSLSKNKETNDYLTAGFIGLIIIMLLYNLFLYVSTKDHIYGLYIGYLFFMGISMPYANGYPFIQYFNSVADKQTWNNYFLLWHPPVYFFVGAFCIKYLNLDKQKRKLAGNIIIAEIIILCVIFPILTLLGFKLVDLVGVFQLVLLVFYLTCLFTGYYFTLKGDKYAGFYVAGWTFMIACVFVFFAVINGYLPFNPFTRNILYFGAAIEIWMFSLALGDRMNIIRREKEKIQSENLKLIREQNIVLEETVRKRTFELNKANKEQEAVNEELTMLNEELNTTLESIEIEKLKSERLLRNILPESVAIELKEKGKSTPKYYENATIIFADLVNFTLFAQKNTPEEITKELDPLFLAFDLICKEYNLEKIKTIGDCYMAAGGLPIENDTITYDAVNAAIAILAFIKTTHWSVRIGIHTGPVVAGVIGINKFAYDIWGDTVNIAARMEQNSEPNKINISKETYELVKNYFVCTYRGQIMAKNKGSIDMYFVEEQI